MSYGEVRWRWWYFSTVLFKTLPVISRKASFLTSFAGPRIVELKFCLSGFLLNLRSLHPCLQFWSLVYRAFLLPCVTTWIGLYSAPPLLLFPRALISYHQCSWQVCRHRSLQSSWWGSCTEQWSVQRSLPPLQEWTRSWRQIPVNAGLGV